MEGMYSYMSDEERNYAASMAVLENKFLNACMEFDILMLEHEENLRLIDEKVLLEYGTEEDLCDLYLAEAEDTANKGKGILGSLIDAIKAMFKSIKKFLFGEKPKEEDLPDEVKLKYDIDKMKEESNSIKNSLKEGFKKGAPIAGAVAGIAGATVIGKNLIIPKIEELARIEAELEGNTQKIQDILDKGNMDPEEQGFWKSILGRIQSLGEMTGEAAKALRHEKGEDYDNAKEKVKGEMAEEKKADKDNKFKEKLSDEDKSKFDEWRKNNPDADVKEFNKGGESQPSKDNLTENENKAFNQLKSKYNDLTQEGYKQLKAMGESDPAEYVALASKCTITVGEYDYMKKNNLLAEFKDYINKNSDATYDKFNQMKKNKMSAEKHTQNAENIGNESNDLSKKLQDIKKQIAVVTSERDTLKKNWRTIGNAKEQIEYSHLKKKASKGKTSSANNDRLNELASKGIMSKEEYQKKLESLESVLAAANKKCEEIENAIKGKASEKEKERLAASMKQGENKKIENSTSSADKLRSMIEAEEAIDVQLDNILTEMMSDTI